MKAEAAAAVCVGEEDAVADADTAPDADADGRRGVADRTRDGDAAAAPVAEAVAEPVAEAETDGSREGAALILPSGDMLGASAVREALALGVVLELPVSLLLELPLGGNADADGDAAATEEPAGI